MQKTPLPHPNPITLRRSKQITTRFHLKSLQEESGFTWNYNEQILTAWSKIIRPKLTQRRVLVPIAHRRDPRRESGVSRTSSDNGYYYDVVWKLAIQPSLSNGTEVAIRNFLTRKMLNEPIRNYSTDIH